MPEAVSLPVLQPGTVHRITPTDVSQFVQLDQCERFLRLRLAERAGHRFMEPYGVAVQRIPPLMSLSGLTFEQNVEKNLSAGFPTINFSTRDKKSHSRPANNSDLIERANRLQVGETHLLFQTRLEVELGGWQLRGDVDLIKLTRSEDGTLDLLLADMKSTAEVKVEHRVQVAFYHLMLAALFQTHGVAVASQRIGILFRPPVEPTAEEEAEAAPHRLAANAEFGLTDVLLELIADPEPYIHSANDLVLASNSTANRVGASDLAVLPYSLSFKCDGCLYTEFCMKASAEAEDLSLLPYMTGTDKEALKRGGITTIESLATLKQFESAASLELVATPGREAQLKTLATTWPIGPRLDELVHRAKSFRYTMCKDGTRRLTFIPDKGNSSLPTTRADLNPNLVWLYLDAQHDPLEGRLYLLGAQVVACREGKPVERRSVVRMTDSRPDTAAKERDLFTGWTRDLLTTILSIAQSDENPKRTPIHIVFFNRHEQRLLLEGLARNYPAMLDRTPPLYDFLTQLAAYDSPIASFLDEEVRTFTNYPMTCQSLQSLASFLKFDWNTPCPFRALFKAKLFDYLGKLEMDGVSDWYIKRSRFSSAIPPEYAYAAWNDLPKLEPGRGDEFADYRPVTKELLLAFQRRRLEAIEYVTSHLRGNKETTKTPFTLPEIASYEDRAHDLAHALDEFVKIERMVTLADWKSIRHIPPEQRVLKGDSLLVRYCEEDQEPGIAEQNRENERRRLHREELTAAFRAKYPDKVCRLPKDQNEASKWSTDGMKVRLRIETTGMDAELNELLLLSTLRAGETMVLYPRYTVNSLLPVDQQKPNTPTPKQMLYGQRASGLRVVALNKDDTGRITSAVAEVELTDSHGSPHTTPFAFRTIQRNLVEGELYTLDACPNEWYSYWVAKVVEGLCDGEPNVLYDRLAKPAESSSESSTPGQVAFLAGLDAFREAGLLHDFEPGKREFIGSHATTPILMVQGPPGTGKSYSTAFAVFARIQGAMKQGRDYRVFLTCKTHAATNVLLKNAVDVQTLLRKLRDKNPTLFDQYFDPRLLELPLYRVDLKLPPPVGAIPLVKDQDKEKGEPKNADVIREHRWAIVGISPGGTYHLLKQKWPKQLFGHELCDLLVLDEASQMNLPESLMAALAMKKDAPVVVVGDHRQMPPIVKHDWDTEARRTFRQFQAYRSLFDTLRLQEKPPPIIRFEESFRLHGAMAEFLRREIYRHDGIAYHSKKRDRLSHYPHDDAFLSAVLDPEFPLVVIVHDEDQSQLSNPFEQSLIGPILKTLADRSKYGLDPSEGLGVVVPHRAQRAALQQAFPELSILDPTTGLPISSAVDTVERFQGGERTVVLVSTTESDRGYLLASSDFILDPRRLTVAVSRAKQKLILVASRSVFSLFSPDEETFTNAMLWKNLLSRTCVNELWNGKHDGVSVAVWGGNYTLSGSD